MTRLLIDENLPPALADALNRSGHDAVHVNHVGLRHTADSTIMTWAAARARTVVTCDRDFQHHLWRDGATQPSVIRLSQRGADALAGTFAQAARLRAVLPSLHPYLAAGVSVTLDAREVRASSLPLGRGSVRPALRRDQRVNEGPARIEPGLRGLERGGLERARDRQRRPPELGRGR